MGCGVSQESVTHVAPIGIDMYQKKEMIGVGHHGRVYRCVHQQDKKEYAIKVIDQLQNQANYQYFKQNYLQLMSKLKQLHHSKIMSFQYVQLNEKELSIVTQLSKEGSLKKYIQKHGKLLEQQTVPIVQQIIEGIRYLHNNCVIHTDLKTNNVFLFPNNIVKISDFSIAELYDPRLLKKQKQVKLKNQNMFARGDSLPYMAPEVIKSQGIDEKADLWSLGCILIEMLTGKVPWTGMAATFQQSFKLICNNKYPSFPANISNQCKNFLECCLTVSPGKRSTAQQLLHHTFIRKYSKEQALHFQIQALATEQKLGQTDRTNRILSRNNKKQNEAQGQNKTSSSKYMDQNSEISPSRFATNKGQNSRIQTSSKKGMKQPTSGKLVGKASFLKDISLLSREDILPQILQDQQDTQFVIVNNKKIKRISDTSKKIQQNTKTEESQLISSRLYRNTIQAYESNDRLRVISKRDDQNDSIEDDNRRMGTQPNLLSSQYQNNKDYFKRPLKLLKKRINQKKVQNMSTNNLSGSFTTNNDSVSYLSVEKITNPSKIDKIKIRSNTQESREELIINTQLAKAQRDRYMNEQLVLKKQREEDKLKWENQLKKQAELVKKQLSHRYAYPYTSIPF